MAKIRVMSYLDVGAPQYSSDVRDAMIQLMKMANETSYNQKFPTSITVNSTDKTMTIAFSAAHNFTEGHLLLISNTTSSAFQSDTYRVISASATSLVCKIDNMSTVTYPTTDNSGTMSVKHAPLGWEVIYSTATQYSIRSKDPTSTKNVLTLKEPTLARLKFNVSTYSAPACVGVHVSPTVNSSTGEIIDSYTKGHDVSGVEAFYWSTYHGTWTGASITPSASNITNGDHYLPWWVIGNDKFFYIFISSFVNTTSSNLQYRNATRVVDSLSYRQAYAFGDPEYFGDPSFIDMGGTMLSCHVKLGGSTIITSDSAEPSLLSTSFRADISPSNLGQGLFFMRPLDMSGNTLYPASLSTVDFPYTSTYYNFGTAGSYMAYPHTTTRGLMFFPFYTRSYAPSSNNYSNYYRSTLPFLKFCPVNITNLVSTWLSLDNTIIKSANSSRVLCIAKYGQSTSLLGAYLVELD